MPSSGDALDEIAVELYTLPPGEFTAARNARAKAVDDASLASRIKTLRKPLLAAWAVNLFARESADELREVLDLAAELREAQEDLDAKALTKLGRERRALVRSLAGKAADLAAERGERLTPSTVEAVQNTLNAAMFDENAAAAVATGRLVRPLEAGSDASTDLTDAVAGSLDTSRAQHDRPLTDEVSARRARKERERQARAAEDELARAERAQEETERRWTTLQERTDSLAARERQLRAELERIQQDLGRAEAELAEAGPARAEAEKRVEEAARTADETRDRLAADEKSR